MAKNKTFVLRHLTYKNVHNMYCIQKNNIELIRKEKNINSKNEIDNNNKIIEEYLYWIQYSN